MPADPSEGAGGEGVAVTNLTGTGVYVRTRKQSLIPNPVQRAGKGDLGMLASRL